MEFLKFFSGKSPQDFEKQADSYFQKGAWGPAKIEYEKALKKLEKRSELDADYKNLLKKKLCRSKEQLALEHRLNGERLIEANCFADAEELFRLAIELTEDSTLIGEIEKKIKEIPNLFPKPDSSDFPDFASETEEDEENEKDDNQRVDEEYFTAICCSLPETDQDAYHTYGERFKKGFIALNQGDFETAISELSQALKENSSTTSFIPLELATAHLNAGNYEQARLLLDGFLKNHPESIRAYHLMCEILWEKNEFQSAEEFLLSCSPELFGSLPIKILQGETLFRANKFNEAISLYLEEMKSFGWDDTIAQELAKNYEALGFNEEARDLYRQIINMCQGCGSRVDPFIKQRYADTSFESGDCSTKILEIYLDLSREDPDNRSAYFQKISKIYSLKGNEKEAERFLSFSEKSKNDFPG